MKSIRKAVRLSVLIFAAGGIFLLMIQDFWVPDLANKIVSYEEAYDSSQIIQPNIIRYKKILQPIVIECDSAKIKDLFAKARASKQNFFTIGNFGCFPSGNKILKSANDYLNKRLGVDYVKKNIEFQPRSVTFFINDSTDTIKSFSNLLFFDYRFKSENRGEPVAIYMYGTTPESIKANMIVPNCIHDSKLCEENINLSKALSLGRDNGINVSNFIVNFAKDTGEGWAWFSPDVKSFNSSMTCPISRGIAKSFPIRKIEINVSTGKTHITERCQNEYSGRSPLGGGDQ